MSTLLRVGLCIAILFVAKTATPDEADRPPAKSPTGGPIEIFNGRNLDGLYTWLSDTLYEDPRGVFTVRDGMLHISGDGLGYVATKQAYRDYRLLAEFKWGPRTWAGRKKAAKDSGILVHCVGPDGNSGSWMASIEYQIIQGGVGDFIVVGGKDADGKTVPVALTCEATKDRDGEAVWKKGAPRRTFNGGRINWYGRDVDWKDELGFRGRQDIESPDGEWTRLEVICDGGRITNLVNGVAVNEGFDSFSRSGKIIFQCEYAEVFFRKIELLPLAPRVMRTTPGHGDRDVDPGLGELRVEFDQDMSQRGYSICGGGPKFPETSGPGRWVDPRVFVVPIKLQPGRRYELSVNCPSAANFRNVAGHSSAPYPVVFETLAAGAKPAGKLRPEEIAAMIRALRRAIDQQYSYRDLRVKNWDDLFARYDGQLSAADTPAQFARVAAQLLAAAEDVHVHLTVGDIPIAAHARNVAPNLRFATLAQRVPGWTQRSGRVYTGRFDDGVGYVLIPSWSGDGATVVEPVLQAIRDVSDSTGLVIDVRPNAGGDETLAQQVAGCFVTKPAVYSRNQTRDASAPNGWTKIFDRIVRPRSDGLGFRGKVAVLMGPANMSSCESFLLMMRQAPRARLFGEQSYGSSGNPKPHDLGNGVRVFLPSWRDMLPDGALLECRGVAPDVEVKTEPADFAKTDPVLDAALKWLRE
jgi:3-keto-disaccharide hydrolase/Peptidase family S41